MARAALVLFMATVLAGCGTSSRAMSSPAPPARSVVPWTSTPPSPVQGVSPTAVLRPDIDAPAHTKAGELLTYLVTLTNTSRHEVRLQPCPYYVQWLSGRVVATSTPPPGHPSGKPWDGRATYAGVAKETYSLNCAGVSSIPTGTSVTFEIRLRIPRDQHRVAPNAARVAGDRFERGQL